MRIKRLFSKKCKMAITITEALNQYSTAKKDVSKLKSKHTEKRTQMRNEKVRANIKNLTAEISNLRPVVTRLKGDFESKEAIFLVEEAWYNRLRDSEKLIPDYKNRYEAAKSAYEAAKTAYEARKDELSGKEAQLETEERKRDSYTVTQEELEELERANSTVEAVLMMIAADPEINEFLQGQIRYEYDSRIASYDTKKQEVDQKYEDLEKAIKLPEFKKEYDELKSAYQSYKTQTGDFAKYNAFNFFIKKKNALSDKLKAKGVLRDIVLDDDDYIAIAQENFDVPSKQKEQRDLLDEKTGLETKRNAIIAKIAADKFVARTGAAVIPSDLQTKLDKNRQDTQNAQQAKDQAETELTEIANNATRLQELQDKSTAIASTPEKAAFEAAKTAYEAKVADLKSKGFISKAVLPDLEDSTSELAKKYEQFKKLNKEVREAILTFEGDPTDVNKQAIVTKAAEYKALTAELQTLSGMDAEAWNKYFMRELEADAKSGKKIDDVFFDDIALRRANAAKEANKIKAGNPKGAAFQGFEDSIKALTTVQDKILNGKSYTDKDITDNAKHYTDALTNLDALGVTKDKILSIMKNTAVAVKNKLVAWFNNFRSKNNTKRTFEPKVKYAGITDMVAENNDLKGLLDTYNSAKAAYTPIAATPLTPAEQTELADLEAKAAKKGTLTQTVADKTADLTRLQGEKVALDAQVSALPKGTTTTRPITDGGNIIYQKGAQQVLKAAKQHYEDLEK